MVNHFFKPIIKFIANSALFVCGIILTVGISTLIAFGAPPSGTPNFKSFTIGRAPGDNFGLNIFGTSPYGFLELDYRDSASPSGAAYAADVNSNKAGATVSGYNIGVLGQSKQNSAGNFGRVGVVGQVITPTQGVVGRGILGFLEPTSPSPAASPSNAIPTYAPIASGNLYGIYADAGESRFGNVTVDETITSSNGTTEFEGPTEFLDTLTVNGTVTADKFVLNDGMYRNNKYKLESDLSGFLGSAADNEMLFTVFDRFTITSPPSNVVRSAIVQCPANTVRVSCSGRVDGTNNSALLGYSSFRGTSPYGQYGCQAFAQSSGEGTVIAEAVCMHKELP